MIRAVVSSVGGDAWAERGPDAGVISTANVRGAKVFCVTGIDPSSNVSLFVGVIRRDAVMEIAGGTVGLGEGGREARSCSTSTGRREARSRLFLGTSALSSARSDIAPRPRIIV